MSKWFPVLFDRKFPSKYVVSTDGKVKDVTTGAIIPQTVDDKMGMCVVLESPKNTSKTFNVNAEYCVSTKYPVDVLVANAFVYREKNATSTVFHKDGDKFNNDYKNLSWISPRPFVIPIKHAVTDDQLLCVCKDLCEGKLNSITDIAKKNNVKRSYVSDILYRRRKADMTKGFLFNPKYFDNAFIVGSALNMFLDNVDYHTDSVYIRLSQKDKERFEFVYKWIEANIEDIIKKEKRRIRKCGGNV